MEEIYNNIVDNMTKDEIKEYLIELRKKLSNERKILLINFLSIIISTYIDIDLFFNSDLNISYNVILSLLIIVYSLNFDCINDNIRDDMKLINILQIELK